MQCFICKKEIKGGAAALLKHADKCMRPKKRQKYNAKKTLVDGILFDSKKEAARWVELKALEKAGVIKELTHHPSFSLEVYGEKIAVYKADSSYIENGQYVVEDVKGFRTREYKLKRKLMKACHGIDVREV